MKKPEEVKKGLECCTSCTSCPECPYNNCGDEYGRCTPVLISDAFEYTYQLEAKDVKQSQRIAELEQELSAVKRERDAAVSELPHNCWNCKNHLKNPIEETDDSGRTIHRYCDADYCFPDEENSSWEWRGICPENTEVSPDA